MALIVKKFGGTSLGSIEKIQHAASLVVAEITQGNKVVVVASAMAGVTDHLVSLTKDVSDCSNAHAQAERDAIIATGESVSSGLFALVLQQLGYNARSWQGWQIPIRTDCAYSNAKIINVDSALLTNALAHNIIPVITGFQGYNHGRVTTLGRGGSDTTAAAIAAALKAERCDIYTDVDGIYTSDPNKIPKARKIKEITYTEIMELADAGAKVLHPRCVEIAAKHNFILQVKSTFKTNSEGTLIIKEHTNMEKALVTAIAKDVNFAAIKIDTAPSAESLAQIHVLASDANFPLQNIQALGGAILISVPKTFEAQAQNVLKENHFIFSSISDVCMISIIGVGLKTDGSILPKIFEILSRYQMNLISLNMTANRISFVTEDADDSVVQQLHSALGLDKA